MCYLNNPKLEQLIEDAILANVQSSNIFTGYDIAKSIEHDMLGVPSWKVSSYVRELFNKHSVVFAGYACYPIPVGPLVFFPMKKTGQEVRTHVEKIQEVLEEAA